MFKLFASHRLVLGALSFAIVTSLLILQPWNKKEEKSENSSESTEVVQLGSSASGTELSYVGSQSCKTCHQAQWQDWKRSHHAQSMQEATEETVLGNFDSAVFSYGDVKTEFTRRSGSYFVKTDGPDGSLQEFEVKYTFGIFPLQQYLLELPGGRMQALSISWDTRAKEEGGQRWFHLFPNETVNARDELHWTAPSQNWNSRCAECHSTGLKKGFDLNSMSFDTHWEEVDVACEACHGPASKHLSWAASADQSKPRGQRGILQTFHNKPQLKASLSEASEFVELNAEVEACGRCHSRRSTLTEDYISGSKLDHSHLPVSVLAPEFYVDGQIREEDFEYSSFKQSKMFHAGVSCSNCHDAHSQKLRAKGNELCTSCHEAKRFDNPTHHRHQEESKGADCVSCHMPTTVYMGVHARHDHSLRVPRPDLSLELGTPNACTQCHLDKSNEWARDKTIAWYGNSRTMTIHFSQILDAAAKGAPNSGDALLGLARAPSSPKAPAVIRASAIEILARNPSTEALRAVPELLRDRDAMIRRAALSLLLGLPEAESWSLLRPMLSDESLAVRSEAARIAAPVLRSLEPTRKDEQKEILAGIATYLRVIEENAEDAQAHVNAALLYTSVQDYKAAEAAYRTALRIDPKYVIAAINFSHFMTERGAEGSAGQILLTMRSKVSSNPALEHALGLHYVRQHRVAEAKTYLENAVRLAPAELSYSYVLAIAEYESGDFLAALRRLEQLSQTFPNDGSVLQALVALTAVSDPKRSKSYQERLDRLSR